MYVKISNLLTKRSQGIATLMGLSIVIYSLMIHTPTTSMRDIHLQLSSSPTNSDDDSYASGNINSYDTPNVPTYRYKMRTGNTLSQIFTLLDIPRQDFLKILKADINHMILDSLQPNDVLSIWINPEKKYLETLEIKLNASSKLQYKRSDNGHYYVEMIRSSFKGEWIKTTIKGRIITNFFSSAQNAGLSMDEINFTYNLLKDKINFNNELRSGDTFDIVRSDHYINNKPSGKHQIEAIRFQTQTKQLMAFRHRDGHFYDQNGDNLQRIFKRYPTIEKFRISSHFSSRRKHPVTGRMAAHNGTDFAVRIGTPVVSTGDGVVLMAKEHPYAGKYVVIDHGEQLQTRYLHNSKIMVHEGQQIRRGQLIALSGDTGRVTGPHIHYEMLIKDRPIDPMKAHIPMVRKISNYEMDNFLSIKAEYEKLMQ